MNGPITACQACASRDIESVLFLGYHPLCNSYRPIGEPAREETTYPLELYLCPHCQLVQLGYIVAPELLFPADYPYTSGTTKVLRDNFADLARWVRGTVDLKPSDLVVDIGSNDGTLLRNFAPDSRMLGITPEDVDTPGITTHRAYFSKRFVDLDNLGGAANVVTCTNCFAHVPDPHDFLEGVTTLLAPGGIFVVEVQYLYDMLDKLYFDNIYAEHMRYLTLTSLGYQLDKHGLEVFRVQRIPTHGGSIRVWAARKGERLVEPEVAVLAYWEGRNRVDAYRFGDFGRRVADLRDQLWAKLVDWQPFGIGAPSRASTLLRFCGIDRHSLAHVFEAPGSARIGKYMPGTNIPVLEEPESFSHLDSSDSLLLLSHHIADELIPKIRAKGFRGRFIVPLPSVEVIDA